MVSSPAKIKYFVYADLNELSKLVNTSVLIVDILKNIQEFEYNLVH